MKQAGWGTCVGAAAALWAACAGTAAPEGTPALRAPAIVDARRPFVETLPGTTVSLTLAPVPGGRISTATGGHDVEPFYLGTTEVPWEAYDVLVFGLDEGDAEAAERSGVDATSRPSTPYIDVDRGFGHNGYPAMSISLRGARTFCAWLSEKTGRRYRLPTEAEWELACRLGSQDRGSSAEALGAVAWYRENAGGTTHPVGSKAADALGLFDLSGNVAEWCEGADGSGVVCGGAFTDAAEGVGPAARKRPSAAWNASDPQIPTSRWWLADAPFVGFRVVCTDAPPLER